MILAQNSSCRREHTLLFLERVDCFFLSDMIMSGKTGQQKLCR